MGPSWKRVLEDIGPRAHIEAAGAFALAYNDLEWSLYGLLDVMLHHDDDIVVFMFSELNNSQKVDLIKHISDRTYGEVTRDYIEHGLRCFAICAENRNIIMHASPAPFSDASHLYVVKGIKGRPGMVSEYAFSLSDLRDAAKSAHLLSSYIYALVDAMADMITGGELKLPWPEKPQQPRKLSLSRRPEFREGDVSPP